MRLCQPALFIAVAAVLGYAPIAHAQTMLMYKFKEGEKLPYELEQKMKMSININGMKIDTKMTMSTEFTWLVDKVKDGKADVKIKFNGAKMSIDGPTGLVEVDSRDKNEPNDPIGGMLGKAVKAMGNMEMTATLLPTGEMTDVKVSEETMKAMKNMAGAGNLGDMLSPDSFKTMVTTLVFPAGPVSKGKTWTNKVEAKSPVGKTITENTYTYEGTTMKDGMTLDKIAISPKQTIEADPNAPLKVQFKEAKGSGHALFDNTKGRIVETTTNAQMEIQVGPGDMSVEQTMTVRLKKQK